MDRELSERNKRMQSLLKKATFGEAINELISLREALMNEMLSWREILTNEDYCAIPFINADGYHSKTIAYSIWHIIRIEDITVNTLIREREEVLFAGGYDRATRSPIITTGNELVKNDIALFSKELSIEALYDYARAVFDETNEWLRSIGYEELKRGFTDADKERIKQLRVVSEDEKAAWLIDYWCGKDVAGLIRMPLSRHWIMHIEAADRIRAKIVK